MWDKITAWSRQATKYYVSFVLMSSLCWLSCFYSIIGIISVWVKNDYLPDNSRVVLCTVLMTKSNLHIILAHRIHKHIVAKGKNEINATYIISKDIINRSKNSCWPFIVEK